MVHFGDQREQPVPTKGALIKEEGSFVDKFGNIPITISNDQIKSTEEVFYEIHNIHLWQFKGEIYLSLGKGHEINFFGKEPSGSQIFQSGRQGQKVRSH